MLRGNMKIRRAVPGDAIGIATVHIDTWRTTYKGIVPDEHLAKLSYRKRAARWQANLTAVENPAFVYVAEIGSQIVGFAAGGPEREGHPVYKGEIWGIYVLESHQRGGIGRRLLRAVVEELRQRGFSTALVWVLKDNPFKAFYEALSGQLVSEKEIEIGGVPLVAVAYGWTCLNELLRERTA